jgi:hypothetical protein
MNKVILALMVSAAALMADGLLIGVGTGYSNVEGSATINGSDWSDTTKAKTIEAKVGYENDEAKGFIFLGVDKYEANVDTEYYGFEFDKKFNDLYVGVLVGFGKLENTESFRDIGAKVGYDFKVTEEAYIDAGLKAVRRAYKTGDARDDIIGAYIGINFN